MRPPTQRPRLKRPLRTLRNCQDSHKWDAARVAHGRYLVQITGCAACHTDGALIGEPSTVLQLAGSHLGIAYTSPFQGSFPGVAYPSNLTPDPKTGLGNWTDAQIATAIRKGSISDDAANHLVVMSWPLYQQMTDDDVEAIVSYLRTSQLSSTGCHPALRLASGHPRHMCTSTFTDLVPNCRHADCASCLLHTAASS